MISGTQLSLHCIEAASLTEDHSCLCIAQNLSISTKFPLTLSIKTISAFNTLHVFLHPYGTRDILLICLWRIGTSWLPDGITIVATTESHSKFPTRPGGPRQLAWKLPKLSISFSKCYSVPRMILWCLPLFTQNAHFSPCCLHSYVSVPAVWSFPIWHQPLLLSQTSTAAGCAQSQMRY